MSAADMRPRRPSRLRRWAGRAWNEWVGRRGRHRIDGVELRLRDPASPRTLGSVVRELRHDEYALRDVRLEPGDVVVDVGAHVGAFACLVAKRHPQARVIAFEPIPENFAALQANLAANGIGNVTAVNRALSADGRELELVVALRENSGGGSAQQRDAALPAHQRRRVPSTTLDEVLAGLPGRCRLLKIDCEGSEHEILRASRLLDRVDHLRGEFHINGRLREEGHSVEGLLEHCARSIPRERIHMRAIHMAE